MLRRSSRKRSAKSWTSTTGASAKMAATTTLAVRHCGFLPERSQIVISIPVMVTEQPSVLPGRSQMVTSFPVTLTEQPSVSSLPVIVTAPVSVAAPSLTTQSSSSLHVPFNHPYALTAQLNSSGVNVCTVAGTPATGNNTHSMCYKSWG